MRLAVERFAVVRFAVVRFAVVRRAEVERDVPRARVAARERDEALGDEPARFLLDPRVVLRELDRLVAGSRAGRSLTRKR